MLAKTFALGGLATLGSAHMLMSNPVPFAKKNLNNSPLAKDGSDFPCKVGGDGYSYDLQGASNVYQQGSTQQLAFVGSAVHGGGSCQVSVTTDLKPTKQSVWKVIKSIEGGCPAKGQSANMGSDANAPDPYKYDFTIPNELATGNYTLAWTWFNKVGNREMYMNCAPLTVTGSGGSSGFLDSLPDMHKANIGDASHGCKTEDNTDLQFPDPGKDVDRFGAIKDLKAGSCPGGSPASQPATASQPGYPASSPTAAPGNPVNSTKPAKAGNGQDSTVPGGVFMTVSSGGARQTSSPTSAATVAASAQPDASIPSSAAPPNASSESGSGTAPSGGYPAGTPCTSEGAWNCIGGNSFQRCASGVWSPVMGLAGGVSCNPGQSTEFKLRTVQARRVMRRALRL